MISFQRYDFDFEPQWVANEAAESISAEESESLKDFMEPKIMKRAYELASKCAPNQVDPCDFPACFDQGTARAPAMA